MGMGFASPIVAGDDEVLPGSDIARLFPFLLGDFTGAGVEPGICSPHFDALGPFLRIVIGKRELDIKGFR